jgi:hypothetical protein
MPYTGMIYFLLPMDFFLDKNMTEQATIVPAFKQSLENSPSKPRNFFYVT